MLSWWTWTWWETIVVALLASIALNTFFTGTADNFDLKGGAYVLLIGGVFTLAVVAAPALLK
jgi:hypothetical protein